MEAFLNKDVELELRFRARSPRDILHVFRNLSESQQPERISSVTLIDGPLRSEIFFEADKLIRTETITKKQLYSELINLDGRQFKLSIAKEEAATDKPIPKVVRIKQRYRFMLDSWYCDITLVKPCVAVISQIRSTRLTFFKRAAAITQPDPVDDEVLELELECRQPEAATRGSMEAAIRAIFEKHSSGSLVRLSQLLGFRGHDATLKKLLPNAIELSKTEFINQLWPRIQAGEFAITDKADGERMILHALSERVELLAGEIVFPVAGEWPLKESIFECEVITLENEKKAYVYDVLMYDGKSLIKEPFEKRWKAVAADLKGLKNVYLKKYAFLKNYSAEVRELLEAKYDYDIDGLIFSSLNRTYTTMEHYKWKPIETSSIDFLCKRAPEKHSKDLKELSFEKRAGVVAAGSNTYYLFCSISARDFRGLGLRHLPDIQFSERSRDLFPVHFCPSSNPKAYIFKYDGPEDIDNQIVEMGYTKSVNNVGHEVPALRLMRVRYDRQDDLKKGYYGNYFRIAEFIWNNYNDPLTADTLIDPANAIKESYFQKPSEEWRNVRKHNNNVKRALIMKHAKGREWVLDLACGKGQDILKYRDAGVRNLLMVDSVPDNISQVIQRKYDILRGAAARPIGIYTFCIDLTQPAATTLKEVVRNDDIGFIACNLAIHYLLDTPAQFTNTIKMFAGFCSAGAKIMITSLDGAKIFDLLKGSGGSFRSRSGKFEIKKMWTSKSFIGCGQRISVKLPFAAEPMEETLVNYKAIEKEFKKYKIKLLEYGSFGKDYLKELTEEEREYIDLHTWTIWQA